MKEYKISNDVYELTVSEHGAEIRSLKKNGRELMWQADPKFWGRTSPVLFPLVGNYWEKKSRFDGKVYEMSQHGFARDQDFCLVSQSDEELVFKNPSDSPIFFSIGGHPAFNCDLETDGLMFKKKGSKVAEPITAKIIEGDGSGCLSERTKDVPLNDGVMKLSYDLFDEDALIIEDQQADTVALLDSEGKEVLSVSFDSPLFGIWSPTGKKAPFVCIEPWYGRCDRVGFTGDISEREYGNKLEANEEFSVHHFIG